MNPAVRSMLGRYKSVTLNDCENALKEIMQELALLGLWRAKFFEHAAFYGGTALRILHGLDRFSDDLDFSLLKPQKGFRLETYLGAIQAELAAMGFTVSVEEHEEKAVSAIRSAFIKAGTREHLMKMPAAAPLAEQVPRNRLLKVKLEVDTDPPGGFNTEARILLQPIPFTVSTYRLPDLFAGKIHAVLCRQWKTRVKGRDYYDFVWYVSRQIPVSLSHLEQRLRKSGAWTEKNEMQRSDLLSLLERKFLGLDVEAAAREVAPFLADPAAIDLWSKEFFLSLLPHLKVD